MNFNVLQDPPSQVEIEAEKRKYIKYAVLSLIIGIPLTIIGFVWLSYDNPNSLYIIFAGTFVMVLGFYNQININSELSNICGRDCDAALTLCNKHKSLEEYRKKIVNLNRNLTNGEYQMMVDWDKKETQQVAFHSLHFIGDRKK